MTDKLPETVDEAIHYLLSLLDDENRNNLKNMKRSDLILLHKSYGLGIRNALGLWGRNEALCNDPEIAHMHPDGRSHHLIERMWDYLNGQQDE